MLFGSFLKFGMAISVASSVTYISANVSTPSIVSTISDRSMFQVSLLQSDIERISRKITESFDFVSDLVELSEGILAGDASKLSDIDFEKRIDDASALISSLSNFDIDSEVADRIPSILTDDVIAAVSKSVNGANRSLIESFENGHYQISPADVFTYFENEVVALEELQRVSGNPLSRADINQQLNRMIPIEMIESMIEAVDLASTRLYEDYAEGSVDQKTAQDMALGLQASLKRLNTLYDAYGD